MRIMKLFIASALILVIGCGEEGPTDVISSALDVLPDEAMFSMAITDPEAVVNALDGYAAGVPVLGENAVSGWILSLLDCSDMSEVEVKLGIDVDGELVIFMQSMMPQSFGVAVSVTDTEVFWNNLGIIPEAGEPIDDYDVTAIDVDFGKIYFCDTNGLLLGAGSRAGLQAMLENLDGNLPESLPGIPDGSIYLYADIASFGPMAATQLAMVRPQLVAEMNSDPDSPEFARDVLGIYFDAINLILTETESVTFVMTLGPEDIMCTSKTVFVPGSSLDQYIIPVQVDDMTSLVPAGNIAMARVSMDPVTSKAAMNAVFGALGITDIPEEMVNFWAESGSNTAMSMTLNPDNPMHLVGVYEMLPGNTIEDVYQAYVLQFQMMNAFMGEIPGVTLSDITYEELDGRTWITFGMDMDMSAFHEGEMDESVPMSEGFSWRAWLTLHEGVLYIEMAQQPELVPQLIEGTWQGEVASDIPLMQEFSDSAEFAMLVNIPEYVNMAMSWSGLDLPVIESDPVWMQIEVDITDEGVNKYFSVSGTGLTAFIGSAIGTFGAMSH